MRHKDELWAVYVASEVWGKGIGGKVVSATLGEAKKLTCLEKINI